MDIINSLITTTFVVIAIAGCCLLLSSIFEVNVLTKVTGMFVGISGWIFFVIIFLPLYIFVSIGKIIVTKEKYYY